VDPLELAHEVGELFESMAIPWVLGGSLASSMVGEPRSTMDIDMAVRMGLDHVDQLVAAVIDRYYVSADMVREAVIRKSSFNILHYESALKVDIFVLGEGLLDRRQIDRRRRVVVDAGRSFELWTGSTEDQVLRKLAWFRSGGEVSDRQWRDVLGILVVQADRLNVTDLVATGQLVGLADLVQRALLEAGIADS
jgi:hypothetical protein